ncbi:MAG: DNA (cytosine-5-)-methyltransferase [Cytophagales bacterium]|nr:DNA (cytosine-5-)-methyltransferase [Cytophagales bacterium]
MYYTLPDVVEKPVLAKSEAEQPTQAFSVIELFAGAGGLAIGMEQAGLQCVMLNELNKDACKTLVKNRPHWDVRQGDIKELDFTEFAGRIDVVTGGFPCQAFSYAGRKLGFEDARGTLFFEFARAVKEIQPLICVGENVRGLLNHDNGKTLEGMVSVLDELGYDVLTPRVLKAVHHRVPQKRERLLIVGLRKGAGLKFDFPKAQKELYTMKDALKKGRLFDTDVPKSEGQTYPLKKKQIMDIVPPGGYWRDLPLDIQKSYMMKSFFMGGGKTGMARRLSWDEPSLTLTCNPAQKQTERCHPEHTRPLTVREYARIQTFPDAWQFEGSISSCYKQIGNAVPVNLAQAIGQSVVKSLNAYVANNLGAARSASQALWQSKVKSKKQLTLI